MLQCARGACYGFIFPVQHYQKFPNRVTGFVSVARQNVNNSCEHQKITSFHSQHFQPSTAECEHAYMKSGNNYGNPEFGSNLIIVSYNYPLKNI